MKKILLPGPIPLLFFNPFGAVGKYIDLFRNMPLFFILKLISGFCLMLGIQWVNCHKTVQIWCGRIDSGGR